jgi:SNF2 family DNA or RNA helicase
MIRITIEGEVGTAYGPFEYKFLVNIATLSGRKTWKGTQSVRFHASPANIRRLKESAQEITWEDKTGELAAMKELEELATQHAPIEKVKGSYKWGVQPFPHQEEAYALSLQRGGYAYLLEMGLGKTAIALANAGELHKQGKMTGVLVLAPKGVHRQWLNEQIPEHLDPSITANCVLWKKRKIETKEMNQRGLTFLAMNIDAIRTKTGFDTAMQFLKVHSGRSMMVIDESQLIKSWKATRTRAAWKLGDMATYRRICTGTPIAKNIMDAWAQFYFLDWKILGHKYVTSFRSRYCIMGGYEGRQIIGQRNIEEFYQLIAPHAYRKTKAECLNLPPKIYTVREYDMDDVTRRHYKSMKDTFMTELKSGAIVDAQHAAVAILRLQQIICGYLPDEGKLSVISDERLNVLLDVIDQVNGPVVIWCRFTADINRIYDRLTKRNEEGFGPQCAVRYYGEMNEKERDKAKAKFLSGEARFFVGNTAAGGTGLNLQGACQTAIYYSNSFRALDRWQSEDRLHRMGTVGAVTYIDIVANASVDRLILRNLKAKKSISDLTFDQIRMALAA